jgi:hypothetical protein
VGAADPQGAANETTAIANHDSASGLQIPIGAM